MPKELNQGVIDAYIHSNKKIGVLLELKTETDFAAKTDLFKNLAHDLAMQVAAMGKKNLNNQPFIKNPEIKVKELIAETKKELGEPIELGRIIRYAL